MHTTSIVALLVRVQDGIALGFGLNHSFDTFLGETVTQVSLEMAYNGFEIDPPWAKVTPIASNFSTSTSTFWDKGSLGQDCN